ncbi:hypothetical protein MRB53_030238 [Persea americana]|uniref:Uncharacterized protein n=1 Tax=Persea americana TaxID=3435 RepID=A0ACC2KKL4_PERAE|nr:hypothetical protein MRB53_030238 [Persea americana]
MQEYLHQLKIIADQLATCGAPVSEEDLNLHALSGLPSVYRPFQTSIRTRSRHDPVSLEELHTLLVCEELSLVDDVTAESSTAFAASKSSFQQGRSTTTPNQYQRRSTGTTSRSSRTSGHRQNPSIDNQGQRQQPHVIHASAHMRTSDIRDLRSFIKARLRSSGIERGGVPRVLSEVQIANDRNGIHYSACDLRTSNLKKAPTCWSPFVDCVGPGDAPIMRSTRRYGMQRDQ